LDHIRGVNKVFDIVDVDAIYLPIGGPSSVSVGNSHSVSIDGGSGDDSFYISHHEEEVTVHGSDNDDLFYVYSYLTSSSLPSHLQNARLNVVGSSGAFDQLQVNGTAGADTLRMRDGQITGSGLDIAFSELEAIDYFLEAQADILVMEDSTGVDPDIGEITIHAGSGPDVITLGSKTNIGLDQIFTNVTVHADAGLDILLVEDTGSAAAKESVVSATSIIGLLGDRTAHILYSLLEVIDISASQGANRMTIVSTPTESDTYVTFLDSADVAIVHGTGQHSDLTVAGGGGDDNFFFYGLGNETLATVYGESGDDSLYVDGTGNQSTEAPVNLLTGSQIRWSGGDNNDAMHINLCTYGNSLFDIFDDLDGVNKVMIDCPNEDTTLLSRESFLAHIHRLSSSNVTHPDSTIERINLVRVANASELSGWSDTASINSIFVRMNGGRNRIYFDDTMAPMDVYGGPLEDGKFARITVLLLHKVMVWTSHVVFF